MTSTPKHTPYSYAEKILADEGLNMKTPDFTPGPWIYDPKRTTHDSCIYTKNAIEEDGYISSWNGGVLGSSEWIWLKEEDGVLMSSAPELYSAVDFAIDCPTVAVKENPGRAIYTECLNLLLHAKQSALGKS